MAVDPIQLRPGGKSQISISKRKTQLTWKTELELCARALQFFLWQLTAIWFPGQATHACVLECVCVCVRKLAASTYACMLFVTFGYSHQSRIGRQFHYDQFPYRTWVAAAATSNISANSSLVDYHWMSAFQIHISCCIVFNHIAQGLCELRYHFAFISRRTLRNAHLCGMKMNRMKRKKFKQKKVSRYVGKSIDWMSRHNHKRCWNCHTHTHTNTYRIYNWTASMSNMKMNALTSAQIARCF